MAVNLTQVDQLRTQSSTNELFCYPYTVGTSITMKDTISIMTVPFMFVDPFGRDCWADYIGCDYDSECPDDEKCCKTSCGYYDCDPKAGQVCKNQHDL